MESILSKQVLKDTKTQRKIDYTFRWRVAKYSQNISKSYRLSPSPTHDLVRRRVLLVQQRAESAYIPKSMNYSPRLGCRTADRDYVSKSNNCLINSTD